ncbi:MAG: hypothetical protein H0T79_00720 [Deltaproteobacteria bacterium]|nr:hypothetical protein [Deltaproteobacteria bacterium]
MRALTLALLITSTTFGCSKTETTTSTEPATSGTNEPAKAKNEVTKLAREVDDKATEVVQAQGAATATANTANAAAEAVLVQAHNDQRATLQKAFDAADRRFNTLKATAATATGTKKAAADAAAADIKTREAAVMAGIAKLRDATGAQWDTIKAQVDVDAAALDKSIDGLEATLN